MDTKEFKKLLRTLKIPAKAEVTGNTARWYKRGGHAGKNAIIKVVEAASANGFKAGQHSEHGSADGSRVGSGSYFHNDAGVEVYVTSSYGVTAYENTFTIRVTAP
jgi:hypothetical protein